MSLVIYNTLTKKKEAFVPREEGKVGMYVCGPTTYNLIHLGNARPLIVFDMVRKYLAYKGFDVTYIQNFTDIDDKIINRAKEEGEDPLKLAARYIDEYFIDADALGVARADLHPKVSEHIPEIIEIIQTLINKDHAYELQGDVYFAVKSFDEYGKLSGRNLDDLQSGARVEVDQRKKDPLDFALWKAAKTGEPAWESPWGPGRPGWHIECSAMASKYLGEGFDIHGGGFDLIFPHHENEIAQSEAHSDTPFAKWWMHNGFITINQEKMSKSLGNFFTLREILAKYSGEVVRFYMLSTHYRSPLDFDDNKLEVSKKGLERLRNSLRKVQEILEKNRSSFANTQIDKAYTQLVEETKESFEKAMDDDFNTALALASLFDLARELNHRIAQAGGVFREEELAGLALAEKVFVNLLGSVGLTLKDEAEGANDDLLDKVMAFVLELRQEARKNKDWATSDKIRDGLKELGIIVEDSPEGSKWKRV